MKIAFWDNCLSERGTTVAMYDYAYYNQTLLGNESIIVYNSTRKDTHPDVVVKFQKDFKVFGVPSFDKLDPILIEEGVQILYVIEGGDVVGNVSPVCKTVIHCVFNCKKPHGSVYAAIAPWVDGNNGKYPHVPHMVNLPNNTDDMRSELNIPKEAVVFGRHGGYDQFDIHYVHKIVHEIAKSNPNIYFLLVNTRPFCEKLPNIIHLEPIVNLEKKVAFINTCDAMLWARSGGEIFSCSMGEFAAKNKPIFCTRAGSLGHLELLGDSAFWYNENTLKQMILSFNKEEESKKNWNTYSEYTPEKVMAIFKKVFID